MKKFFILDYDNTVAKSKNPPEEYMLTLLSRLLENNYVSILTAGRSIKGLRELMISNTILDNPKYLKNLLLCPTYGNLVFEYENGWFLLYNSPDISSSEKKKIKETIKNLDWNIYTPESDSKKRLYDKGCVISLNCLGNDATEEEKEIWDVDEKIREKIKGNLVERLGDMYEIFVTGRNTIDIVPKGMNKADSIKNLCSLTSMSLDDCIYFGDEFNPNGNDYPILSLGIDVHVVENPSDTERMLREYV